jgi:hypothetical protein
MRLWVLDDGPFGTLARHHDASWHWPESALHLVSEVAMGAQHDKSGRRQRLLNMMSGGLPCIAVHDIHPGTPADAMLHNYLRQNATSARKDLGEDASVAFCALVQPEAVFVTQDQGAALVALSELGAGRVATPFDLWHDMARQGLVSPQQCKALCESTHKSVKDFLPGIPRRLLSST